MIEEWSTEEARRRWDLHAPELTAGYTSQGDIHREVLLNPALLSLLGAVDGKRVLDAGCGEGYLSRMLAQRGASVVAADYSEKMLEIAGRRTPPGLAIEYVHANFERLEFLQAGTFDVVVANMVLQDLAGYQAAIREAHRVLTPPGAFVFSILHPCFSTPGSGWVTNETGDRLHWKVDAYFDEIAVDLGWPRGAGEGILHFHRTLTSYHRAIREAGFVVEALLEPKPSDAMLAKHPEFREDLRMCHFLVLRATKESG